jgi:serine/threonine protein kinase
VTQQIPTWSGGHATPTNGRAAPGALIGGRYTLRAAVGHGGMGTVWRAADTLLRRDVAVKEVVLPAGLAPSDRSSMYERTMREARAAAALQHPAVVQVYDVVQENGRPWIVMELLEARSLADMVIEDGPVAARVVAKIGIALLGALEVAHAHGVLHRDVKPANVLICSDGRCVLTDFGVARMPTDIQLTTPGMVLGSPHFISPERAMGSEFGPPSDLFSLGVTLYTAVEGRPPFDKGDPIETMHAVVEDPPAPTVRAGVLAEVLMGLLEKDPAQRIDVPAARTILRQLLAGPLASKAPAHLMTDPYSVVPSQRPPATPRPVSPPPAPAAGNPPPTGQIGGRAMLAPGESLTDHLAKLQQSNGRGNHRPAAGDGPPTGAWQPTATVTDGDATGVLPPRESWQPGQHGQPGQPGDADRGTVVVAKGARRRVAVTTVVGAVRDGAATAVSTVQGWPRNIQLAAAGGLAAVVLLGVVLAVTGGGDETPSAKPSAGPVSAAPVAVETVPHSGSGANKAISVQVPKGWERKAAGVYVDYVNPADKEQKVRVLVESTKADGAEAFLEGAPEKNQSKNSTGTCPGPYTRISLGPKQIGGQTGAVLEYTCNGAAKHAMWAAVVQGGKAYEFFVTGSEERLAQNRAIFDEMAKSFGVTPAS